MSPGALAKGLGFVFTDMPRDRYFVYIMSSPSRTLYIGVTNNRARRVYEHKHMFLPGFTARYNISLLVYFEETSDVQSALALEGEQNGFHRGWGEDEIWFQFRGHSLNHTEWGALELDPGQMS